MNISQIGHKPDYDDELEESNKSIMKDKDLIEGEVEDNLNLSPAAKIMDNNNFRTAHFNQDIDLNDNFLND